MADRAASVPQPGMSVPPEHTLELAFAVEAPEVVRPGSDILAQEPRHVAAHVALEARAEDDHRGRDFCPVAERQARGGEVGWEGVGLHFDLECEKNKTRSVSQSGWNAGQCDMTGI